MQFGRPNKITITFILIFLVGILGFVACINHSLEKSSSTSFEELSDSAEE